MPCSNSLIFKLFWAHYSGNAALPSLGSVPCPMASEKSIGILSKMLHRQYLITYTYLHTHPMAAENKAQRRGNVRFSFPDPEHFQQKSGMQQLVSCCNHCVTCLCLRVTTTAKSQSCRAGWVLKNTCFYITQDKMFQKELPQCHQHREWLCWARSKAQLAQHPLSNSGHKWVSKGRK